MDVQDGAAATVRAVVVLQQVLAVGLGPREAPAVQPRGALGEAALRAARGHHRPAEQPLLVAGESVQRVAFGHGLNLRGDVRRRGHTGGMTDATPAPQVWPTLRAKDARGLIRFLVDVVGFEETAVYGEGDRVDHAQLSWPLGGGVMLGSVREADGDSWPLQPGTFGAYVVVDDADALYARVKAGRGRDRPRTQRPGLRLARLRDP